MSHRTGERLFVVTLGGFLGLYLSLFYECCTGGIGQEWPTPSMIAFPLICVFLTPLAFDLRPRPCETHRNFSDLGFPVYENLEQATDAILEGIYRDEVEAIRNRMHDIRTGRIRTKNPGKTFKELMEDSDP